MKVGVTVVCSMEVFNEYMDMYTSAIKGPCIFVTEIEI